MRKFAALLLALFSIAAAAQTHTYPALDTTNTWLGPNTFTVPTTFQAYVDYVKIAQPGTLPASGNLRCWADSTSNFVKCIDSTGAITAGGVIQSVASLPAPGTAGSLALLTTGLKGVYRDFGTAWQKWPPEVNLSDFGAVCNAVADDTTAIQAAYNAIHVPGGTISVYGQCNFTNLDFQTNANVAGAGKVIFRGIDGMGVGESIIPKSTLMCTRSDNGVCINNKNNGRGLTFDGVGVGFNNASFSGKLLDCENGGAEDCSYTTLRNMVFGGMGAAQATRGGAGMIGFEGTNSIFTRFENVHFQYMRTCLEGRTTGQYSNGMYIDGNTVFTKCGAADGLSGATISNAGQAWVVGGHCDGTGGMAPYFKDTATRGGSGLTIFGAWLGDVVNVNNCEIQLAPSNGVTIFGLQSSVIKPLLLQDNNDDFIGFDIFGNSFSSGIMDLGNFTQARGSAIRIGPNYWGRNGEQSVSAVIATRFIAASGLVRSGNVVTVTTTSAHGIQSAAGTPVPVNIASSLSGTFDGTFEVASVPSTTTFTYNQAGGNETSGQGIMSYSNSGIMHENVRKWEVNIDPQGFSSQMPIGTLGHPAAPIWGQWNMPGSMTFGSPVQDTTRSVTIYGGAPAIKKIDLTGKPAIIPTVCTAWPPVTCNGTPFAGAVTRTYSFYYKDKFGKRALTPDTITRSDWPTLGALQTTPIRFFHWCGTNGYPGASWSSLNGSQVADVDVLRDGLLIAHLAPDPNSSTCAMSLDDGQTGSAYTIPTHEESADLTLDGWLSASQLVDTANTCKLASTGFTCGAFAVRWTGTDANGTVDTGLSRDAAGVVDVGNGTAGDASGTLKAAVVKLGTGDVGISRGGSGLLYVGNGTAGNVTGSIAAAAVQATNGTNDTVANATQIKAGSSGVIGFTNNVAGSGGSLDTGFSRDSAGVVDVGNGTAGNASGTAKMAALVLNATTLNSVSGNTSKVQLESGTTVTGNLAKFDANGNVADSGFAPGSYLIDRQGPASAIVGDSTDHTIYTTTLGASQIPAGKCARVTLGFNHSTGTASLILKIYLGTTGSLSSSSSAAGDFSTTATICNAAGVQNSQYGTAVWTNINTTPVPVNSIYAENTANSLVIKGTFFAANTEQVTPKFWMVELIQ